MSENFNKITTSLAELEAKIAFQDHTIEELNQALIAQQFMLEKLQYQVRHLAEKLHSVQPSNVASLAEETPPPHY
ncbi:SlyX family protein [Glaesserella parasuis]|nr:SlyX family protein [Glaesserella parasuis]MDP0089588.1 SlyX family protein [Glaesserella parasuis]